MVDGVHQIALGGDKFYMYVLVGRNKALVVDTQFVAERKGVTIIDRVRAVTDKPLYQQYYERIRCLAPAHNGAPLSKRYIKYFLDLDAAIIAGTAPVVPTADGPNFPFPINYKMVRYRQALASIVSTRP